MTHCDLTVSLQLTTWACCELFVRSLRLAHHAVVAVSSLWVANSRKAHTKLTVWAHLVSSLWAECPQNKPIVSLMWAPCELPLSSNSSRDVFLQLNHIQDWCCMHYCSLQTQAKIYLLANTLVFIKVYLQLLANGNLHFEKTNFLLLWGWPSMSYVDMKHSL